jgi:hypothetical protein
VLVCAAVWCCVLVCACTGAVAADEYKAGGAVVWSGSIRKPTASASTPPSFSLRLRQIGGAALHHLPLSASAVAAGSTSTSTSTSDELKPAGRIGFGVVEKYTSEQHEYGCNPAHPQRRAHTAAQRTAKLKKVVLLCVQPASDADAAGATEFAQAFAGK